MRTNYTIKNGIVGLISQFINLIFGFVLRAYFIQVLSSEYLGLNGLFQDLLSILSVSELGIGSAITFALYQPIFENNQDKITALFNFYKKAYRIVSIFIFAAALCISPFIQVFIKDFTLDINYIRLIFMLFVLNTSLAYILGTSRIIVFAHQQNYILLLIDLVFKTILTFSQIYILLNTGNYLLYLALMLTYTIVDNTVIRFVTIKKYPFLLDKSKQLNAEYKSKIMSNLKYLSISSLISIGVLGTDRIIISSLIGISILGIYSNYALIVQQVQNLFINLLNGVVASFGNLIAEKNQDKIKSMYYVYSFAYFLIASFTSVAFYILLTPFIKDIWLNAEYTINPTLVLVIVFNSYLFLSRQPVWQLQNSAGIFKQYIPFSIIEFFINLSVSIIGGLNFGLIGVFFGSTSAYLISWTGQMYILNKHVIFDKVRKIYIKQVSYLTITISELILSQFILSNIHWNNAWIQFIFNGLFILIFCFSINSVLFYKTNEFQYIKSTILNRINFSRK